MTWTSEAIDLVLSIRWKRKSILKMTCEIRIQEWPTRRNKCISYNCQPVKENDLNHPGTIL